jgi:hypothetical protein
MLNDPTVLAALSEHLTVGGIFRLDRALGAAPAWTDCTADLVARRMRLAPSRRYALRELRARMRDGRHRCAECAAPVRRVVRVCAACRGAGYRALCTRRDLLERHAREPVPRLRARIRSELRVVGLGPGRCHLYWRAVAEARFWPEVESRE